MIPFQHHAVGRKRVITGAAKERLFMLLGRDFPITDACLFAGIGRRTFYDECERDPLFRGAMLMAREHGWLTAAEVCGNDLFGDDEEP